MQKNASTLGWVRLVCRGYLDDHLLIACIWGTGLWPCSPGNNILQSGE